MSRVVRICLQTDKSKIVHLFSDGRGTSWESGDDTGKGCALLKSATLHVLSYIVKTTEFL